jgi:hypothetical protein
VVILREPPFMYEGLDAFKENLWMGQCHSVMHLHEYIGILEVLQPQISLNAIINCRRKISVTNILPVNECAALPPLPCVLCRAFVMQWDGRIDRQTDRWTDG